MDGSGISAKVMLKFYKVLLNFLVTVKVSPHECVNDLSTLDMGESKKSINSKEMSILGNTRLDPFCTQ